MMALANDGGALVHGRFKGGEFGHDDDDGVPAFSVSCGDTGTIVSELDMLVCEVS